MSHDSVDLQSVLDLLPDGMLLVSPDGRIVAANRRLAGLLAMPLADVVGNSLYDLIESPRIEVEAYMRRCAGSREPLPGAFVMRQAGRTRAEIRCDGAATRSREAGSPGPILLRCRPKPEGVSAFAVLSEKVTALAKEVLRRQEMERRARESEERLRHAIEAARLGTWELDLGTRGLACDERVRDLFGLPSGIVGYGVVLRTVHPEDRRALFAAVRQAMAPAVDAGFQVEFRIRVQGADTRWVSASGRSTGFGGGSVRLIGTVLDVTERRRAEARQNLLMLELSHRVKNTLATVQSIVRQTFRQTQDPGLAFRAVVGRLGAIAHTHELLTASNWEGASIRSVVDAEFVPLPSSAVRVLGRDFLLGPRVAQTLSLIVHELTTNAVKYGALSCASGQVTVSWEVSRAAGGSRRVRFTWSETGGPEVHAPSRRGFGHNLIERATAHELGGSAEIEYPLAGLRCTLTFQVDGEDGDSVSLATPENFGEEA
jgi:PAS domain S-box-containing protein